MNFFNVIFNFILLLTVVHCSPTPTPSVDGRASNTDQPVPSTVFNSAETTASEQPNIVSSFTADQDETTRSTDSVTVETSSITQSLLNNTSDEPDEPMLSSSTKTGLLTFLGIVLFSAMITVLVIFLCMYRPKESDQYQLRNNTTKKRDNVIEFKETDTRKWEQQCVDIPPGRGGPIVVGDRVEPSYVCNGDLF